MRSASLLLFLLSLLLATSPAHAADTVPLGGLSLSPGFSAGGDAGDGPFTDGDALAASDDGRYVAFAATADGLAPGAPPDSIEIYRKDTTTGAVVLVSKGTDGAASPAPANAPAIDDTGNLIAFLTTARLAPDDDKDELPDVYVRDVSAGTTVLATPGTTTSVEGFDLAGKGGAIAYTLRSADFQTSQIWWQSLTSSLRTLVSKKYAVGQPAPSSGFSNEPSISDNGQTVAFTSSATDLVQDQSGGGLFAAGVFVRDMIDGNVRLASGANGSFSQLSNGRSDKPAVSGDSSGLNYVVAFQSTATDINGADTSALSTVYRRKSNEATTGIASPQAGTAGLPAYSADIADDGNAVLYRSGPQGSDTVQGLFRYEPSPATTTEIGTPGVTVTGARLYDGGAAWTGPGNTVGDGDAQLRAVFARTGAAAIREVSRPGAAGVQRPVAVTENGLDTSADGRFTVFTAASPLLPSGSATVARVYRRDTQTGEVVLASRGTGPDGQPAATNDTATISADGQRVAFSTRTALDGADADTSDDVYVRDLATATTILASRADGPNGASNGTGASIAPGISPDGRHVVFTTTDKTVSGAADNVFHLATRDLVAGSTATVDRATGAAGAIGNKSVSIGAPGISSDGRLIAFSTSATNLDPADGGDYNSVYVRDTASNTTRLASRLPGLEGASAGSFNYQPDLSGDGRWLVWVTTDSAVIAGEPSWGTERQVILRDLDTGANTLVSRSPATGARSNASTDAPSISADGRYVAFRSRGAGNLLDGYGSVPFIAVFDRSTGTIDGPPAFGSPAVSNRAGASNPAISADGACVAFLAQGHTTAGFGSDWTTPYQYRRTGTCGAPAAPAGGGGETPPVGGPPPVVTPPVVTVPKPVLGKATITNTRFKVGSKKTAISAAKRKTKVGTTFRTTLSAAATLTIRIDQRAAGKKKGKRCVKPSKKLRKAKGCTRYVKVGTLIRKNLKAGKVSVAFSGRLGSKKLKPGRYRATLQASNAGGKSAAKRLSFTVVRR